MYKRYLSVLCSVCFAFFIFLSGDIKSFAITSQTIQNPGDIIYCYPDTCGGCSYLLKDYNKGQILGNSEKNRVAFSNVNWKIENSLGFSNFVYYPTYLPDYYSDGKCKAFIFINAYCNINLSEPWRFTFKANNLRLWNRIVDSNGANPIDNYLNLSDVVIKDFNGTDNKGVYASGTFDFSNLNNLYVQGFQLDGLGDINPLGGTLYAVWGFAPLNASDTDIQTQILNQINQNIEQLDQTIKDQYSGDPNTDLNVNDFVTQHNNKMGVLSFGSNVMIQFLDMFTSTNKPAKLTLPGFSIEVEGKKHQVWQDHTFDFSILDKWLPQLMTIIRTVLPIFIWLAVFKYIQNVFEKYFLSGGN